MIKINIKKLPWDIILTYTLLIIAASLASIGTSYIVKRIKTAEERSTKLEDKPSLFPDYDAIKGPNPDTKINSVKFTSDCPESGCVNDKSASVYFDGINKQFLVTGKFSRAYLYIEAAVDYERPLTNYDDIFFQFNTWGGHLLSNGNLLPVPPGDISRYLYDLRSISYFTRGNRGTTRKFENINFFVLLQHGTTFDLRVSVSSDRPGRVLKEVSFYYQCLEDSACSIDEQE